MNHFAWLLLVYWICHNKRKYCNCRKRERNYAKNIINVENERTDDSDDDVFDNYVDNNSYNSKNSDADLEPDSNVEDNTKLVPHEVAEVRKLMIPELSVNIKDSLVSNVDICLLMTVDNITSFELIVRSMNKRLNDGKNKHGPQTNTRVF